MPSAVIGALRVDLNLGTGGWRSGLDAAARDAQGAAGKFKAVGGTITRVGAGLTAGITAPLVGIGAAAIKTAGDFEAGMIRLRIATQATTGQMKAMNDLALELGKSTVFSASEAAGAMEELAKNGVSVENILNGAAKAAVDLAAAAGSELEPAAVAVSDAMNQFHLSAKDLPMLVNQITGAVNESKLDFADFQLGMAQAGGVAGALGVSFADFNAVLAGTSSMFGSGSDAGTSFKTFLTTFIPKSKEAAAAMEKYNLEFYDGAGKMKSMSEIAGMLQANLGKLTEKDLTKTLSTIFGVDAMRTAVGLMTLGSKGLDDIAGKIAKTDAAAQSAERMKGFNAQLEQLGGTLETLAIQIGQTGLLSSVTAIVRGVTDMLDKLTELSPGTAQAVVAIAALAAAIGPVMLVVGPMISGIGSLITLYGTWSASLAAASTAAGGLLPLLTPFIPVIAGIAGVVAAGWLAWENWDKVGPIVEGVANNVSAQFDRIKGVIDGVAKQAAVQSDSIGKKFGEISAQAATQTAKLDESLASLQSWADGVDAKLGIPSKTTFIDSISASLKSFWNDLNTYDLLAWANKVDKDMQQYDLAKWAAGVDASIVKAMGSVLTFDLSKWAAGVDADVADMGRKAVASIEAMVNGIQAAIVGRLGSIWEGARRKIKGVGDEFYRLYDAVVGHSYVPDMVDGIAAEMARLDAVMVKPVDKATGTAKDAFKKLRDDLAPVLNTLFPESRQMLELERVLGVIDRAEKAGVKGGGLSAEQASAARRRAIMGPTYDADRQDEIQTQLDKGANADLVPMIENLSELKIAIPDLSKLAKKSAGETVEAFAGMARDVVGSLRGMVSAFKGGDILGGISGLFDIIGQVTSLIRGTAAPRQAVTVTGGTPYGGARALGGPVVPGKRYKVGERGPEWLEVGQPGRVIPDKGGAGGGGNTYYFSGVMTSDEFWDRIAAGNDNAAVRGATGGAQLAGEQANYQRGRFLG